MRECEDCGELYVEIKKSFTTILHTLGYAALSIKVAQWAESYRSGTDGELKAAIKTFYNMKAWHDLHVALWTWLSLDGEREKKEWFEMFDVPKVTNYCFACEATKIGGEQEVVAELCVNCPIQHLERNDWGKCANGLYAKWIDTDKIAEREKLAREIATMKWEERI
jgi:hypothetical protein